MMLGGDVMTKKIGLWVVFVLLALVMQSSFLPIIHYNGVGPDLMLLIIGSYAFLNGSRKGCFMGFMLGLFQDLATGNFFGINTFSKMIIGFGCGIFSSRVLQDNFIMPISAAVVSTTASYTMAAVIMFLMGYRFNLLSHIPAHLLPMLCYNVIFAYPIHLLVHKIDDYSDDDKKRRI